MTRKLSLLADRNENQYDSEVLPASENPVLAEDNCRIGAKSGNRIGNCPGTLILNVRIRPFLVEYHFLPFQLAHLGSGDDLQKRFEDCGYVPEEWQDAVRFCHTISVDAVMLDVHDIVEMIGQAHRPAVVGPCRGPLMVLRSAGDSP